MNNDLIKQLMIIRQYLVRGEYNTFNNIEFYYLLIVFCFKLAFNDLVNSDVFSSLTFKLKNLNYSFSWEPGFSCNLADICVHISYLNIRFEHLFPFLSAFLQHLFSDAFK